MSHSTISRGKTFPRCTAKAVDICVVVLLSTLLPQPVSLIFGLLYALLHDAWGGQGLGKRLFRIQTVRVSTHAVCTVKESIIRNMPLALVVFFGIIPLWGWLIAFAIGPVLGAVEIYLMSAQNRGRRLGDVIARTRVIDLTKSWSHR